MLLDQWPVETNSGCLSEALMFGESDALANLLRCCRPQPWMSMTRPAKPNYPPAESVAPVSHRQTGSLHSSSAFEASQHPQSETSSSSDTVETAQLAPVSRQMQHASGIRMSRSEGLFGRCDLVVRLLSLQPSFSDGCVHTLLVVWYRSRVVATSAVLVFVMLKQLFFPF